MSQVLPQTLTCPAGHTFAYEQLTIRDGLSVCPVCDQTRRASPPATWSRSLLVYPLLLLVATLVMLFVENISGVGLGATYQDQHVSGAGWLTAGSIVSLVGVAVVVSGLLRLATSLRTEGWTRARLSLPFFVMAAGAGLLVVGDLVQLGLNIALVHTSQPGSAWELFGQIFDALFFSGIAGVLAWMGALTKRREAIAA